MELEGRAAVLLVVALDLREERLVAGLDPGLEGDDRIVTTLHLGLALEAVERLDRLDRVARRRGAERLAHDPVEVDEHFLAQEVVDLALARPVLAHQPRERGALVGGVVVDVEARMAAAALDDPVDEPLEHRALAVAVARPECLVAHLAGLVPVAEPEEELEPARGVVERVPLEVEPHVAEVGYGQEAEPALHLVGQELVEMHPRLATAKLELCLVTHLLEALGPQAVRRAAAGRRQRPELRQRLDAACLESSPPSRGASRPRGRGGRRPRALRGTRGGSRRSRSGRRATGRSRRRARGTRGTARVRGGSRRGAPPRGSSPARHGRSRRARARPAPPAAARPARRRRAAGARARALPTGRASCRPARTRPPASSRGSPRNRASGRPRSRGTAGRRRPRPARGRPPRSGGARRRRRSPRRRTSGSGRSSVPRARVARGTQPRAPVPSGG